MKFSVSVTFFCDGTGRDVTDGQTDGHRDRQTFLEKYYFRFIYVICICLFFRVTTVYWPAKIDKSQIYLFHLELWDSGETATRKYNHILPVLKQFLQMNF